MSKTERCIPVLIKEFVRLAQLRLYEFGPKRVITKRADHRDEWRRHYQRWHKPMNYCGRVVRFDGLSDSLQARLDNRCVAVRLVEQTPRVLKTDE